MGDAGAAAPCCPVHGVQLVGRRPLLQPAAARPPAANAGDRANPERDQVYPHLPRKPAPHPARARADHPPLQHQSDGVGELPAPPAPPRPGDDADGSVPLPV